jgi:hypothetical protein
VLRRILKPASTSFHRSLLSLAWACGQVGTMKDVLCFLSRRSLSAWCSDSQSSFKPCVRCAVRATGGRIRGGLVRFSLFDSPLGYSFSTSPACVLLCVLLHLCKQARKRTCITICAMTHRGVLQQRLQQYPQLSQRHSLLSAPPEVCLQIVNCSMPMHCASGRLLRVNERACSLCTHTAACVRTRRLEWMTDVRSHATNA